MFCSQNMHRTYIAKQIVIEIFSSIFFYEFDKVVTCASCKKAGWHLRTNNCYLKLPVAWCNLDEITAFVHLSFSK